MKRSVGWRVLDAMGSRPLSVGLMASLMLYLAMLLGFTFTSPEPVVSTIARGVPFQLAYGLIALNTLSCIAVFWRTVRARCGPWHLLGTCSPVAASAAPVDLSIARRWLRRRGCSISIGPDGSLHAGRGRFSALGSPLFHLSILLAAGGALLEDRGGFTGRALVNEGYAFYGEPREYLSLTEAQVSRAPQMSFRVRSIRPEYFGNELFFTELVAEVETPVGPEAEVREVRLSDSVAMGQGHVTLTGFGYSLDYELLGADGSREEEGLATLMVFPPGRRDSLQLPDRPYSIFIEVFPDFVVDGQGAPSTRGMALGDVRVGVTVLRNRSVLAKRVVPLGEAVRFEDLQFKPVRLVPQGQFRVRRSPGVPVLGASFVLILAGLALRLLWTRREVLLTPRAGGEVEVQLEGEWPLELAADLRRLLSAPGAGR